MKFLHLVSGYLFLHRYSYGQVDSTFSLLDRQLGWGPARQKPHRGNHKWD